jgi:hypothetical protein
MKIEGATGGNVLSIDAGGRAETTSVIQNSLQHYSESGNAWAWSNVTYDPDAADTIILVKNTHATKNLYISKIQFSADTASEVKVHLTNGATFTPTGTAIIATSLNNNVGGIPSATAIGDETANTIGNIIFHTQVIANAPNQFDMNNAVVLGNSQSIGVDLVAASTAAYATIWGYYADAP